MPQLGHECCYPQDDRLGATTLVDCVQAIDDQGIMIVKYCTYIGGNRPIGGVDLDPAVECCYDYDKGENPDGGPIVQSEIIFRNDLCLYGTFGMW